MMKMQHNVSLRNRLIVVCALLAVSQSAGAVGYVIEENGEYGYAPAVSEDDARAGRAAPEVTMVRYLGKRDGRHVLRVQQGPSTYHEWACGSPCKLIKQRSVLAGTEVVSKTFLYTPGTVAAAMFDDAEAGALKPYQQSPKARR